MKDRKGKEYNKYLNGLRKKSEKYNPQLRLNRLAQQKKTFKPIKKQKEEEYQRQNECKRVIRDMGWCYKLGKMVQRKIHENNILCVLKEKDALRAERKQLTKEMAECTRF